MKNILGAKIGNGEWGITTLWPKSTSQNILGSTWVRKMAQQPLRKSWSLLNLLGIAKMISSHGRMKTYCRKWAWEDGGWMAEEKSAACPAWGNWLPVHEWVITACVRVECDFLSVCSSPLSRDGNGRIDLPFGKVCGQGWQPYQNWRLPIFPKPQGNNYPTKSLEN